jgi:TolB-like protein/DNA-binding winged helix-turn-helix (wHTH) protein/tetratricopeptide (TPR) repeat protein
VLYLTHLPGDNVVEPRLPSKLKFGVFEVDLEASEVRKSGLRQKIAGQPFEVLRILLEHPQQVVTREDLRQRIWPENTFVDYDLALKKAVNRLRTVLGDSAESPRFIETVPRRGYRFIAPVVSMDDAGTAPPVILPEATAVAESVHPRGGGSLRKRVLAAVLTGAVLILTLVVGLDVAGVRARLSRSIGALGQPAQQIQSIAVLPLANLSGDPGQEYFSDGMTDALITELAQVGSLRVISRTSSMQYKQTRKSLGEIARELHVDGIVEGTVQRSGNGVRITAQLIHSMTDKHLWANSYERDVGDMFLLERDVAGDIARQVRARVTSDRRAPPAQPRPVNPAVLETYLQGNYHMHRFSRGFGDEELRLASQYFQQAIDAEPDFAPAYVGLSKVHRGRLRSSSEDGNIARRAAERAVELDPNLSDGWTALAGIKLNFWDWAGAEQGYQRALELNPNDGDAHESLGKLLDAFGRVEEGWKEQERAQQVDPMQDHLAVALKNRHEYDRIIEYFAPMLEADLNNGYLHYGLYEGYSGKRMYKEAIQQLEQALSLFRLQELAAKVRAAFAASGYEGAMRAYAEGLEQLHRAKQLFAPINGAEAYTAVGDKDRAFYWLEEGYKNRGRPFGGFEMIELNRDSRFEPLHSDPRYKDLLRRVGLPP